MARETREQWAKRIGQWQRSGLDAASFAAREGVKPELKSLPLQDDKLRHDTRQYLLEELSLRQDRYTE